MNAQIYDLCVIGGGVNGAGIARDAAGRGLNVLLVEARDLASGTSSMSTKLIHGGLRYLENFDFGLVRESLKERERLFALAPHIIWPLEFVLPHDQSQRPSWMISLGLFFYDHLAKRKYLNGSKRVKFGGDAFGAPLSSEFKKGFSYSDCWVEDSRLVVLNAVDAAAHGAEIMTYTKCTGIVKEHDAWQIALQDHETGEASNVRARMVVNAAGPWVSEVIESSGLDRDDVPKTRLVKGSHIIVPRQYDGDHAYILQQPDKRIVFAIPYEQNFTLIGTTEEDYEGDIYEARLSDDELDYLVEAYNRSFEIPISESAVLWGYSGVRPLIDDGEQQSRKVSREHKIYVHEEGEHACLSVFGGKLTTYRKVAEEVVEKIMALSGRHEKSWTDAKPLPGGDIPDCDFEDYLEKQVYKYPWLDRSLLRRFVRSYGTRIDRFLDGAKSRKDLGQHFGNDVYEAEIVYLLHYEFAKTVEDILWRRSKLGIHIADKTRRNLEAALPDLIQRINAL